MTQKSIFEKFFNNLATDWVSSPSQRLLFKSIGIDPSDWPHGDAKRIASEYEAYLAQSSHPLALRRIAEKIRGFGDIESLPTDAGTVGAMYEENLTALKGLMLAERILEDPKSSEKHISEFRKRSFSSVNVFEAADVLVEVTMEEVQKILDKKAMVLIPGWETLSKLIGGFNPQRLSVLLATSGMGKTALALNLCVRAAEKVDTLFINMEMSKNDIVRRIIQMGVGISSRSWYEGVFDAEVIQKFSNDLKKKKSFAITDGRALPLSSIQGLIIQQKETFPDLGFVVIDYDQKIRFKERGEEWMLMVRAFEEIEEIAKSCDLHILILAQGSDEGKIKSSQRALQPLSTAFEFLRDGDEYFLEARKNRHGASGWRLGLNADLSKMQITEGAISLFDNKNKGLNLAGI